ncbi:MAG: hypothetical protein ACREX9_07220, partial [Gammaproteobacteria bacterium]
HRGTQYPSGRSSEPRSKYCTSETDVQARSVREDGGSHWTVTGPGGMSVEWDAVTTKLEQNRLLAWRTVPGAAVEHAGMIQFARR